MEEVAESPPSSPLSNFSKSPTPPFGFERCEYPSPTSIQLSESSRSPSKSREAPPPPISLDNDGPPPTKKRKLAEPKKRTTEYLDLRALEEGSHENTADQEIQLQRLLHALRKKRKIVVIAGAGISVSAGIPDFRSSTGLFSSLRNQHKLKASGKHLFDAAVYKSDSSTSSFHDMVRELSQMTRSAKPTLFHHMLATLAEEGRLLRLYTQNVDGIDTALEPLATTVPLDPKGPWPKTIQLHGGLEKMVCTKCGKLSEFNEALFEGPDPPPCRDCEEMERVRTVIAGKRGHGVGRLRPRMVLYNEFNPDEDAIGAVTAADLRSRPDAVIVVGTSLKVPGVRRIVREMCWVARGRRDGFTAWINSAPEPIGVDLKGCWDLVVRGDSDEVARQAALPKWDDKDTGLFSETTREMVEKIKRDTKLEIVVDVKHKAVETVQGIVTPGASPRHQSPAPARTSTISNHPIIKFKSLNPATSTIASKSTTTNAAPKTKRPSKKKAITEPKKQTQKITSAFNVTKVGNATVKSEKEPNPTTPQRIQLPMFPNLKNAELPLEPMSPNEVRQNLESSPLSNPPSSPILQHSPDYLNQTERQQSSGTSDVITYCDPNQRAMISPKSKPNNMNHLIH